MREFIIPMYVKYKCKKNEYELSNLSHNMIRTINSKYQPYTNIAYPIGHQIDLSLIHKADIGISFRRSRRTIKLHYIYDKRK